MNATEFQDTIEADYETELSRLGSSKALYAVTAGEMESTAVLGALADRALTAAMTFQEWAESDGPGSQTYARAAEVLREQADRIANEAGDTRPSESQTRISTILREQSTPVGRAAGYLAWGLVWDRTLSQAVGFFVGNAERAAADLFRDIREEEATDLEQARTLLDEICTDDADWTAATETASTVVAAAYDQYVEILDEMGIKVKPVC